MTVAVKTEAASRSNASLFMEMEGPVTEAAGLATALAMAVAGMGKLAFDDEDELYGLTVLANQVAVSAIKAKRLWYAAHGE